MPERDQTKNASTPFEHRLKIFHDGRVETCGVNHETSKIQVVARNESGIVLKVAGHSCWAGNYCDREYVSPYMMAYKIEKEKPGELFDTLYVEPLVQWSTGRKKKS